MRLIDADVLKETIPYTKPYSIACTGLTRDEVLSIIDYANVVDPVIHAVWVCKWECSNCGFDAMEEKLKWKFCPNCGAKIEMKGEL